MSPSPAGPGRERWVARAVLLGALAYLWPLVDDIPVNLDQALGTGRVLGVSSHIFMEVFLHLLSLAFFSSAILVALEGSPRPINKMVRIAILGGTAFFAVYLDDIAVGVPFMTGLRDPPMSFVLEGVSLALSVGALFLAVREARTLA